MSIGFVGPDEVACFRAITVASALDFYARYGQQVNKAYTPTRMMAVATSITGETFRRRDYAAAATALRLWVKRQREIPFDPPYSLK